MNLTSDLTDLLIQKGLIKVNTEIDADYMAYDIAGVKNARTPGNFMIMGAKKKGDTFVFEGRSTVDGSRHQIDCRDVRQIDGMSPNRFAETYGLTVKGDKIKEGKRRGRKPKETSPLS